jgi:hypothetical protein
MYGRFGGTCCFNLQGVREGLFTLKMEAGSVEFHILE